MEHFYVFLILTSIYLDVGNVSAFESSMKSEGREVDGILADGSGVIDHIQKSINMAKQYFASGLESAAANAADFVSKAFKPPDQGDSAGGTVGASEHGAAVALRTAVRLLGLDPAKLGALALNAIVFVAQLITTSVFGKEPQIVEQSRKIRSESPSDWILEHKSEDFQKLLSLAKSDSLLELILDTMRQKKKAQRLDCVELLVCKLSPFVFKMQHVVFGGNSSMSSSGSKVLSVSSLFEHVPSKAELIRNGIKCDKKYPDCVIIQ